ncbi:MAG: beta-galactosidase, partial [Clostridia bacterium]|nr:beta-galactosidase [Clostridia bacterium]
KEEAENYEPPHTREEQSSRMWALWRIFSMDNMNAFLHNAAIGSKEGSALPTFTCLTTCQVYSSNYASCVDYFGNAKKMDILGYTTYIHANGAGYYPMCLHADIAQCAAELEGKESWCIELDSRTYIPSTVYNRGTFAIIGAGAKGIVYYQWRGDCPVPGVPYPNSCGILNYDGTKTGNFDNAVAMNRYVAKMNDLIMAAKREHMGIGLLHSDYATLICDSREKQDTFIPGRMGNLYLTVYTEMYRQLRDAGYNVSITDAQHLKDNKFKIKVLFVPSIRMLSDEEKKAVDSIRAAGVRVFENVFTEGNSRGIGFKEYRVDPPHGTDAVFDPYHTVYDITELTGVNPVAASLDLGIGIQVLCSDGYRLLVLTNKSSVKQQINAKIRINIPFITAEFFDIDGEHSVRVNGDELSVTVKDGGIIVLK